MKVHHIGLNVRNLEASTNFYTFFFDLNKETEFSFLDDNLVFLHGANGMLELIEDKSAVFNEKAIHLAWEVESIQYWLDRLEKNRLLPALGPFKLPNEWKTVFYEGPDGETIELIEKKGHSK
ncbi:VOC family protein [Bacillus sp. SJS]|uniref:VOC family protein n=1 Tax=Bacillus sp. SJS TaxID=1423321 RepID=UPI0005589B8C|nr:VOC family protein [Bacillus sp. SJS]KZZ83008.1 hypothetical protein AS29_019650 [Bacillus sp. SJS]